VTRDEISTELQRIEGCVHEVKARLWECRAATGYIAGSDLAELIGLAEDLRTRAEQFEETLRDAGFLDELLSGDDPL
jgi:hypothetical protein